MAGGSHKLDDEFPSTPWGDEDKIGRKDEGQHLKNLLEGYYHKNGKKNFVLNIDASWGYGKSFFLRHLYVDLKTNHHVIFFNAWENDFSFNPLAALIFEITSQLPRDTYLSGIKRKLVDLVKTISPGTITTAVALTSDLEPAAAIAKQLYSSEEGKKLSELDIYEKRKKAITEFKITLKKLSAELESNSQRLHPPLYILVDELDRCRPTYAIELLEVVKHLFEIDGIYFLIATDTQELAHTVNAVYGEKFNSASYLNRFFKNYFTLSKPKYFEFVKHYCTINSIDLSNLKSPQIAEKEEGKVTLIDSNEFMVSKFFEYFQAGLRDMEQCLTRIGSCILSNKSEDNLHLIPLTYLVIARHMQKSHYDTLLTTSSVDEVIDNIDRSGKVDRGIYVVGSKLVKDTFTMPHSGHPHKETLSKITRAYFNLLGKPKSEIASYEPDDSLKNDIARQLEDSHSSVVGSYKPSLLTYIRLVDQSGAIRATR